MTTSRSNRTNGKLTASKTKMGAGTLDELSNSVISELQRLNFGDYEAKAYIALLKCGPATAYEVAKVAELPRANAYTVLNTLTKKGAVQPVNKKPIRYMPVEPKELFKSIAENTTQTCSNIIDSLASMQIKDNSKDYVWSFKGQVDVMRKILELLSGADHHVWLKGTARHLRPLIPEIKKTCWKGISVVIVAFAESTEEFECDRNCKVFLHEANGITLGGAENFLTVTADSTRALIASNINDNMEASYSENYPFVYMIDVMIKHEIYLAEIMGRFGDKVEAGFGPGLKKLRSIYNFSDFGQPFEEYISRREKEITANQHAD